jgi:hypothetical protein
MRARVIIVARLIGNWQTTASSQAFGVMADRQSKRQTVMIVTGAVSDWQYLPGTTDQSLKRQSAFNGGKHD